MASQTYNLNTYKSITTYNTGEIQINNSDIHTYVNTSTNIHKSGLQGELIVRRFFASDGSTPATYNLATVDSHNLIFSIDSGVAWNRILSLDIRSTDIYTCAKTSSTWGNWTLLLAKNNYVKQIFGNANLSLSTLTVEENYWGVNPSGSTRVFGFRFKDTALTTDTGDWVAWLEKVDTATTLNMRIDGTWQASKFIGPLQGNADTATKLATAGTTAQFYRGDRTWSNTISGGTLYCVPAASTDATQMAFNGGIQLREAGGVGNAQSALTYAPRISFHWSNRTAKSISLHSDGIFYFRNQNGTDRSTIDANVNGNAATATCATRQGVSVGWHKGRDAVVAKTTTINNYSPTISVKTTNGSWEIGSYNNASYTDKLIFSYVTDANYNSNTNSHVDFTITTGGYFSGSCASASAVPWTGITSNPGIYANDVSSYGNVKLTTAKGGYYGIHLGTSTSHMTVMSSGQHNGLYVQAKRWVLYYDSTNDKVVLGSSSASSYRITIDGDMQVNNGWIRATGARGWYNESYGGGMYMEDTTWVRVYGSKKFYVANSSDNAIYTSGGVSTLAPNGLRITYGGKAFIFRNDGSNTYFMPGSSGDVEGNNWASYYSYVGNADGYWHFVRAYGAVWNDYAEYRIADTTEPGRVVQDTINGKMILVNERLASGCKIISDTYGFAIGETEDAKTPIAVSGRVLVYPYQNKEKYEIGAAVCSAPGGTVDIMTREEIIMYPERIIGTVSEIPNYEIWEQKRPDVSGNNEPYIHKVPVYGRIWIYVR